jgi:hypothetical protein
MPPSCCGTYKRCGFRFEHFTLLSPLPQLDMAGKFTGEAGAALVFLIAVSLLFLRLRRVLCLTRPPTSTYASSRGCFSPTSPNESRSNLDGRYFSSTSLSVSHLKHAESASVFWDSVTRTSSLPILFSEQRVTSHWYAFLRLVFTFPLLTPP